MTYKTVTCGHDWGPAIDKIILDLDQNVESKQVDLNSFLVWVKQTDKDNQVLNHSQRTVVKAYTSDASGNETGNSRYITLELEIGPTLSNGSLFIYNRKTDMLIISQRSLEKTSHSLYGYMVLEKVG